MRDNFKRLSAKTGCLLLILAPITGAVFYPSVNWLFAVPLVLIVIVLVGKFGKGPDARYYIELGERLLTGPRDWDVDDYESVPPRDPHLKALVHRTMEIGGLPENWVNLEESKKNEIRALIQEMRGLSKKSD